VCIGNLNFLYCPSTAQNISVTIEGTNGASGPVTFPVGNANLLLTNISSTVINGLAGPNPGQFDFGLPFFFGRHVFTAIEGKSTPGGTGPYLAY
jgi:hypothetical protein